MRENIVKRRGFAMNAEDHHVDDLFDRHVATLEVFEGTLKRIRQEEACSRQDPVVRVPNLHHVMHTSQDDCRVVGEEKMSPAQVWHGFRKRNLVLAQYRVLDEGLVILLFHGDKHAHDIADEVRTAFWHAIEKDGFPQPLLHEVRVELIEVVTLGDDSGHG